MLIYLWTGTQTRLTSPLLEAWAAALGGIFIILTKSSIFSSAKSNSYFQHKKKRSIYTKLCSSHSAQSYNLQKLHWSLHFMLIFFSCKCRYLYVSDWVNECGCLMHVHVEAKGQHWVFFSTTIYHIFGGYCVSFKHADH